MITTLLFIVMSIVNGFSQDLADDGMEQQIMSSRAMEEVSDRISAITWKKESM